MKAKESITKYALWCSDCCIKTWRLYKRCFVGRPWYIKLCSSFVTLVVLFFLYLGAVDINLFWLFGKSPSMDMIKNPVTNQASEIYSADGVLIGKYFNENRIPVKYEDVNPIFWTTLIDTEDERFYSHHGIDYQAFAAAFKDYVIHHSARGASTITQQLVKNMFRVRTQYSTGLLGNVPGLKMLVMKSKEWITAVKIEMLFSKEEILTMYANTVDFGSNAFGIKTAAKTYFGVTPKELTPDQCAVLVGMLKATTTYNPRINPENSLNRRNVVLGNLLSHGHITQEAYDSLKAKPIHLDFSIETAYDGQALYFREAVANYLKDWCKQTGYDIYTDGLRIETTIDTRMQRYAEEAAWEQMQDVQEKFNNHWGRTNPWIDERHQEIPGFIEGIAKRQPCYKKLQQRFPNDPDSVWYYMNLPHKVKLFSYTTPLNPPSGGRPSATKASPEGRLEGSWAFMSSMDSIRYMVRFMHCGFVAMEPQTGEVKAWVGDIDFDSWKYDKVTAMRQPGSTFKLFVYAAAMNAGLTPCDRRLDSFIGMKVYDEQQQKEVYWAPTNANGYFTNDEMPLKAAFAMSINSVAVKLGQEVGIPAVIKVAKDMGIKSKLEDIPSLPLGANDVTLLELTNAYCTAVNDGKWHEPVLVKAIYDRNGKQIYKAPSATRQALSARSAFLTQQLLMSGMREPDGTSMRLWHYVRGFTDTDFGGKTGTSNNHSDAWFVGACRNLVAGAWVGGEYRCIHFRTGELGQGSRTALPICGLFFEKVLNDKNFAKYHGKFPSTVDGVSPSDYSCPSYYDHHNDTLNIDSIAFNVGDYILNGDNKSNGETPESDGTEIDF